MKTEKVHGSVTCLSEGWIRKVSVSRSLSKPFAHWKCRLFSSSTRSVKGWSSLVWKKERRSNSQVKPLTGLVVEAISNVFAYAWYACLPFQISTVFRFFKNKLVKYMYHIIKQKLSTNATKNVVDWSKWINVKHKEKIKINHQHLAPKPIVHSHLVLLLQGFLPVLGYKYGLTNAELLQSLSRNEKAVPYWSKLLTLVC